MAGCHTLLICAHLCLSVGGTSLPEGSVCSAYSVGHSLCLLCWCSRGNCTSVVVFSHGIHGIHGMLGCVIGGVGMAGCHTLLISAHLCLSVGGTSLPEGSVCSAYSVGHSLCLLCWCICGRHISAGFRPPSNQIASAARSDSVRHPIRFRSPSNQIAFATRSDCVRHPIRFRPLHDAISRVCTLRRFHFNIQHVPLLHPFMFAKLRNKFDF